MERKTLTHCDKYQAILWDTVDTVWYPCDVLEHPVLTKAVLKTEKAAYSIEKKAHSSGVTIYAVFFHTNTNFLIWKLWISHGDFSKLLW